MEGVSWMNYFLVIFIALPLVFLLMVKVTPTIETIAFQKQTLSDSCFQVTYNRMEHDKMLPLATECEARTNMLSRK